MAHMDTTQPREMATVQRVVVDATIGPVAADVAERCRITGTPFAIALAPGMRMPREAAVWAAMQERGLCEDSPEILWADSKGPGARAVAVASILDDDDVVVTDSLDVASRLDCGTVFTSFGRKWPHAPAGMDGEARRSMLETLSRAWPWELSGHPTPGSATKLLETLTTRVPKLAARPEPSPAGTRMLVDADNVSALPARTVGRTRALPVMEFHNPRPFQRQWPPLSTDPTSDMDGFWVDERPVPLLDQAADRAILAEARPTDIVLTDDRGLAVACVHAGCAVVDAMGTTLSPDDLGPRSTIWTLWLKRSARRGGRQPERNTVSAAVDVIEGIERLLRDREMARS